MRTPITFTVLGLPVGKQRAGYNGKTRQFYTRHETRVAESTIGWQARIAMHGRDILPGAVMLAIDIFIHPPKSWTKARRAACLAQLQRPVAKPDTDNVLKTVKDACNGIVWIDDKQVCSDRVDRWYVPEDRMVITVMGWEPPDTTGRGLPAIGLPVREVA